MTTATTRDMAAHLALVRDRVTSQNLSVLELRDLVQNKARELSGDVTTATRERLQAEIQMIGQMSIEAAAPELSPTEQVAEYRQQGRHDLAEALEHGLAVSVIEDAVQVKRNRLSELRAGEPDALALAEIEKLQVELETPPTIPTAPHVLRQEAAEAKLQEAQRTRVEANALSDAGLVNPADYEDATNRAAALESEAAQLRSPAAAGAED